MKTMRKIFPGVTMTLLVSVGALYATEVSLTIHETGRAQLMSARMHLRDESGKAIKPPGLPAWNDHFVCTGSVDFALSPGSYRVEVERGPEFASAVLAFQVTNVRTNFTLTL